MQMVQSDSSSICVGIPAQAHPLTLSLSHRSWFLLCSSLLSQARKLRLGERNKEDISLRHLIITATVPSLVPNSHIHIFLLSVGMCLFGVNGHRVQGAAVLEPFDLALVEGVIERRVPDLTVFRMNSQRDRLANLELGAQDVDAVVRVDLVIVGWIGECEGEHALFLQVGLVLFVESLVVSHNNGAQEKRRCISGGAGRLTIRAKLRVMIARPPRCLGSRAACSREDPSP